MRFTKIPLIATLMAVALSLLIVLPTLAQVSGDRTDGRLSVGDWIDVRVADKLTDDIGADTATTVQTSAAYAIENGGYDAKDTYFGGTLYISNQEDAFNTILITAKVAGATAGAGDLADVDDGDATNGVEPCAAGTFAAVARITNNRSNTTVRAYLVNSGSTETRNGVTTNIYHGIAAIWDQEEGVEEHTANCVATGDPEAYVGSNDQSTAATATTEYSEIATNNPTATPEELAALQARFVQQFIPEANADNWTDASAAVIPARDGDTITVTVDGVSGSIRLVVDGDAPEVEDATPVASDPQKSTTVNVGFTVSDDGSGIRYDGESGDSTDVDLQPHNGDGDQRFDEPITIDPVETGATQTQHNGDGSTQDITLYFRKSTDEIDSPTIDEDNDPATPETANPNYDGIADFDVAHESSQYGSNGWTQVTKGVEYGLDMRLVGKTFGTYYWQVTVKDRVGNSVTTDSDDEEDGDQPYSFKVDNADPMVSEARTGIGYESGAGEIKSRSWIALHFINEPDEDDPNVSGADRIRASSVNASDFTVEGHTVVEAVVPGDKATCKDDKPETPRQDESAKNIEYYPDRNEGLDCEGYDPRTYVYLQLASDLDSDAEPTIQLLGGVLQDIAGNNNVTQSIEAVDWIAPGVTITITSSSGATGRAATDDDGSFTFNVSSDEDLGRFPRLFFATIHGEADVTDGVGGTADGLTILDVTDDAEGVSLTEGDENTWSRKVNADSDDIPSVPGTNDRIVAAIITARDDKGNSGNSAGWTDGSDANGRPNDGENLDFKKLDAGGFLLEIDNNLAAAEIEVLPSTDPGSDVKDETESTNPYIQIVFSEADEYGINVTDDQGTTEPDPDDTNYNPTDDDEDGISKSIAIKDSKPAKTDSHPRVTITSLTLDGEDRLSEVVEVNAYTYVLAVTGLDIGEHEIVYSATDDVGNDVEDEDFTFDVLERQPYEVELQPGWNLISIPGDPFNPAVGSVIGSDLKADTVLGYQSGEWVTAVKNEDGRWQGTLVDIQGGYGYWVRTTAIESIETVIPPTLPTSVLPTVPIISGWNLVGVVDAAQREPDEGVGEDADEYLTSLGNNWRVGYSFETQLNRWEKILPNGEDADGTEHMVLNGKGYWLWSSRPGTLVP